MRARDIHIGRASTATPETVPLEQCRTVNAWEAVVDLALREQAHAVCLTGDVADEHNKFFESAGPLERGVERLAEQGIDVYAVAGNHDHDVLPRLADELAEHRLRLLGRDGQWERVTLEEEGVPVVHLDGWSFPSCVVGYDPVSTYPARPDGELPALVMVHGDLAAAASRYAPLSRRRLREQPVDGWLLGHIHASDHDEAHPFILYPGSPQAMHPGETDAHGAWIVEVKQGRVVPPRFVPLSTVRYERVRVDATDIAAVDELQSLIRRTIRAESERLAEASGEQLACLSLRLVLTGRTRVFDKVESLARDLQEQLDERVGDDVVVFVERVDNQVEPAIDLEGCAQENSPLGAAARLLLDLNRDKAPAQLVRRAIQQVRLTRDANCYSGLSDEPLACEPLAREYLKHEARRLVNELYTQAMQ